ncbi:MAG: superoxide dismutase family protein [Aquihabitans sp.]
MPNKTRIAAAVTASALALGGGATLLAAGSSPAGAGQPRTFAYARIIDNAGAGVGTLTFRQSRSGVVTVIGRVSLPTDSSEFHGFHVHANADALGCVPGTGFTGAGGHWDVGGHTHGNHTGDLASLQRRSDGTADVSLRLDKFTAHDLIGKAVVVHTGPDNFANVPLGAAANQYTDNGTAFSGAGGTAATGNAGSRYGCGVIR